jgi:hypothetical protein
MGGRNGACVSHDSGAGMAAAWAIQIFTIRARLPLLKMMASRMSRHSGWVVSMPRSRQISTMTAPAGW